MKLALFLAVAAVLIFSGCTTWDDQTGKFFTTADNQGIDITRPNGSHFHIDSNLHSPIIHAYGSAGGRLIGAAAAGAIGYKAVGLNQVVGAGAAILPGLSSPRATPAPKKAH